MAVELRLVFVDNYVEDESEPYEFTHTLAAPEGLDITGGAIFIESPSGEFDRFTFRITRDDKGKAQFEILEDVKS